MQLFGYHHSRVAQILVGGCLEEHSPRAFIVPLVRMSLAILFVGRFIRRSHQHSSNFSFLCQTWKQGNNSSHAINLSNVYALAI